MKRTIVVNLIAPPNSEKTKTATLLYEELLKRGVTCGLANQNRENQEFARYSSVKDEIYLFSKQFHQMFRLHGNVEVIVTDKPLMLSLYYNHKFGQGYYNRLNDLILEQHGNFYNMNFYLDNGFPSHEYDMSKKELMEMDEELKDILKLYNIDYTVITDSTKRVQEMANLIFAEVEDYRASEAYKIMAERKIEEQLKIGEEYYEQRDRDEDRKDK